MELRPCSAGGRTRACWSRERGTGQSVGRHSGTPGSYDLPEWAAGNPLGPPGQMAPLQVHAAAPKLSLRWYTSIRKANTGGVGWDVPQVPRTGGRLLPRGLLTASTPCMCELQAAHGCQGKELAAPGSCVARPAHGSWPLQVQGLWPLPPPGSKTPPTPMLALPPQRKLEEGVQAGYGKTKQGPLRARPSFLMRPLGSLVAGVIRPATPPGRQPVLMGTGRQGTPAPASQRTRGGGCP